MTASEELGNWWATASERLGSKRVLRFPSMITVRARVRNGRLIVDEATDLPEGTELDLVADELAGWLRTTPLADEPLTTEEVDALAAIRARAKYSSHEQVRARLDARKR